MIGCDGVAAECRVGGEKNEFECSMRRRMQSRVKNKKPYTVVSAIATGDEINSHAHHTAD